MSRRVRGTRDPGSPRGLSPLGARVLVVCGEGEPSVPTMFLTELLCQLGVVPRWAKFPPPGAVSGILLRGSTCVRAPVFPPRCPRIYEGEFGARAGGWSSDGGGVLPGPRPKVQQILVSGPQAHPAPCYLSGLLRRGFPACVPLCLSPPKVAPSPAGVQVFRLPVSGPPIHGAPIGPRARRAQIRSLPASPTPRASRPPDLSPGVPDGATPPGAAPVAPLGPGRPGLVWCSPDGLGRRAVPGPAPGPAPPSNDCRHSRALDFELPESQFGRKQDWMWQWIWADDGGVRSTLRVRPPS
ncbi:hypothetical protein NDU88_003900 [Pleurodeles waltl]|uniref:Uncharacterized protein n=1 Tax=Pleurodeles waltl TaxID=8319 RepID=A0AAV7WU07_PLEWA|nr:hypothetical protein NDU88_003900 [Pleurodeles waltl]